MTGIENTYTSNNNRTLVAVSNADGTTPVNIWADPITHGVLTAAGGRLVTVPFDYVARVLTNATTETYSYKSGGSSGTTVATVTVVYTDSTLATLSTVTKT